MTKPRNSTIADAERTRVIVGGALIALAWVLAAVVIVALLLVLPDHHVRDYAWAVVGAGLVSAGLATYVLAERCL